MSRRRRHEHTNHERWLVSYADFITLLFAFFVVLYALSRADAAKFEAAAKSMRRAFGESQAAAAKGSPPNAVDLGGRGAGNAINPFDGAPVPEGVPTTAATVANASAQATSTHERETAARSSVEAQELKQLSELLSMRIRTELATLDAARGIEVLTTDKGVVVRLSARDFYATGEAAVRTAALPVLDEMAKVLKTAGRHIRIEGHTDNTKASSVSFPSNWELSTARASWVARYFIQRGRLEPRLLEASGYAEYHPIADNDSEIGRSRNRRIEILVLKKEEGL